MRIILSGGGTAGSVTPLLAIKEAMQSDPNNIFLWIGTKKGMERAVVEAAQISYKSIPSGKLRRYFDWRNFIDPFLVVAGFFKSLWFIWRFKPDIILTAGSFVCVPVVLAGAVLRKKSIIHQQDLRIGLANKIMKPFATKITVAFEELIDFFPKDKVVFTGNPVRQFLYSGNRERAYQKFAFNPELPVILVMGGGIGSEIINKTFIESSKSLTQFCQVIHLVGKGEQSKWLYSPIIQGNKRYRAYEFLTDDLADAYAVSTLVVCRGGLATLTEIAALRKPAIVIPIPKNQQEDNAEFFKKNGAVVYVRQEDLDNEYIINLVRDLLEKSSWRQKLSQQLSQIMPSNATQNFVKIINDIVTNQHQINWKKRVIDD